MENLLKVLVLGLAMIVLRAYAECPASCTCLNNHISCEPNTVTSISNVGDESVTQLNLVKNRLAVSTLTRDDFRHLKNLEELSLADCGIVTIEPNTFADLTSLKLLDLSLNNLRTVSPDAFAGLSLEYLFLGDNPGIALPRSGFTGMSTEILSLKSCDLKEISVEFLRPLMPTLNKLYISANQIETFPQELLEIFSQLEAVRIQENPLICDCQMRWLKQFYDDHTSKIRQLDGSLTEPRCSAPSSNDGKFFNSLTMADFTCDKPTLDSIVILSKEKSLLRCTSTAHPPPRVTWYKPDGSMGPTALNPEGVTIVDIEVLSSTSDLKGLYRCIASNDAGNTTLSVNLTLAQFASGPCAGSEETTSREIILANNNDDQSQEDDSDKCFTIVHLIAATFGTFAGTLVVTVLVLHFCIYRKRKSAQYGTPPNSEYSGGSIKNEAFQPPNAQHLQIRSMQQMQTLQSRPLPTEPCHRSYDENHYMSTQLPENEDIACFRHRNAGTLVTQPQTCQQCQPIRSHSAHTQILPKPDFC